MQRGTARARSALAALVVMAAGCAVESVDEDALAQVESVGGGAAAARYDLSCRGTPLPARASELVTLRGFTNDSYMGTALGDVEVALIGKGTDAVLDVTASSDDGRLLFELATEEDPVDHYARMIRPGHVDSYLYPSRPLVEDAQNVFFPVLPPTWRAELAAHAGVEIDPATGIVAVIVTDCAGERVQGATVTFDPPAETVAYWDPTFTDASATATTINGHAWGFNVPAGEVRALVEVGGVVYRDWPVKSFADSRTLSWRAP